MQKRFSLTCKSVSNAVCKNCISSSPVLYSIPILYSKQRLHSHKSETCKKCIQRSRNTCEKSSFMSQAVYFVLLFFRLRKWATQNWKSPECLTSGDNNFCFIVHFKKTLRIFISSGPKHEHWKNLSAF